jgi:cardiolipin synthase
LTLANWITSVRFLIAPFVYWQLVTRTNLGLGWAIALLCLAGISDVLDGWVARVRNEVSELGKVLDPLADKLLILTALAALAVSRGLPWWLVIIYSVKEMLQVMGGFFLLQRNKAVIPANQWGKTATLLFFIGFGTYFIHGLSGITLISLALGLSCYAFYSYYRTYREQQ